MNTLYEDIQVTARAMYNGEYDSAYQVKDAIATLSRAYNKGYQSIAAQLQAAVEDLNNAS